ncbi:type IV pilus modification protein PilV [Teredinibacter haidensis]|uniref:type IV pilus modification protein PilV n=1 Tax=Teredinibacter haidensis TaxID=2731755 RepID=UPI000949057C|nr:type IV pilus modification protein PilV [Teredinibacter haidensis]
MSLNRIQQVAIAKTYGFSMIEVLVSFIVLAGGLLGIASVQKRGVDSSHAAYLRTQAVSMAQDMASRVRANNQGFKGGSYDKPTATYSSSCLTTSCSAAAMAAHDNYEWQRELAQMLPTGEGMVCLDSSPDDGDNQASPACDGSGTELVIKIWWDAIPKDGVVDQRYSISFGI